MAAKNSAADVAALDSNIQGSGVLKIIRRTDITYIRVRHKPQPPEQIPVAAKPAVIDLAGEVRDFRLLALLASGVITQDEYIALQLAA